MILGRQVENIRESGCLYAKTCWSIYSTKSVCFCRVPNSGLKGEWHHHPGSLDWQPAAQSSTHSSAGGLAARLGPHRNEEVIKV